MNEEPPSQVDWWDLILTLAVGGTLSYFFFEPGKEAISGFVQSLLPFH